MKIAKILGFIIALLCTNNVFAQKDKGAPISNTYVNASAVLSKTHTEEELKAMGKSDLVKVYMERVSIITEITPYLALRSKPGATLKEMGIPESAQNTEHLVKESKNKSSYLSSVKDTLDDITFYADKDNIIWCIMFFEEMIQKAEAGK
jgi:hypothetical protein